MVDEHLWLKRKDDKHYYSATVGGLRIGRWGTTGWYVQEDLGKDIWEMLFVHTTSYSSNAILKTLKEAKKRAETYAFNARYRVCGEHPTPGELFYEGMLNAWEEEWDKLPEWDELSPQAIQAYESGADALMSHLQRDSAWGRAIDDIHKILSAHKGSPEPEWNYPGQIVRDVAQALNVDLSILKEGNDG